MLILTLTKHNKIEVEHEGKVLSIHFQRQHGQQIRVGFDGPRDFQITRGKSPQPERREGTDGN